MSAVVNSMSWSMLRLSDANTSAREPSVSQQEIVVPSKRLARWKGMNVAPEPASSMRARGRARTISATCPNTYGYSHCRLHERRGFSAPHLAM